MAKKTYYTEEEAAGKLGVTVEQLTAQFVREGKLRAFQDGARRMFKVDDVDALSGGKGEEIELTPVEGGDAVSLSEADKGNKPSGKEDTVITAEGISIFDDEDLEIEAADPLAKTQIAPTLEDQISIEGVGSGSGLLDLTRESDDTSLGAEVLDHIDMEGVGSGVASTASPDQDLMMPGPEAAAVEQAVVVEAADPMAGLFGGLTVAAAIMMLVAMTTMVAAVGGVVPGFLDGLKTNLTAFVIGIIALAIAGAVAGYLVGKSGAARRSPAA